MGIIELIEFGFWLSCGMALFALLPLLLMGLIAIPCSIIEYVVNRREDKKKTKELIAKGADPKTFFVKGGIIYQKDNEGKLRGTVA